MMPRIKIGIIGFGTIGSGVVKILETNGDIIKKRIGTEIEVIKIADLDISTDRGLNVDQNILTTDAQQLVNHTEIDIVVELIGGYEPARSLILQSISNGKHVVTANKALLAIHGDEIFSTADHNHVSIGFEASVGGAIPVIRSIRESFVANKISSSLLSLIVIFLCLNSSFLKTNAKLKSQIISFKLKNLFFIFE